MKIALGVFDGIHRGHQQVIARAHRVITFDPHPNSGVHLLTTINERADLIGNLDIIPFTKAITQMAPQDFVEQILLKKYKGLETIYVGHDFAFGYNREGNVDTLIALGKKYNFTVEVIPEVIIDAEPVRSSHIRKLLGQGDITTANKLLGRDYQIRGTVIHGHGRGAKLGFPTINIKPEHPNKLIPKEGVYAADLIIQNKLYRTAVFIGACRTFNETKKVVEAHILNFTANVYGECCTLFLKDYIRAEQKFKSESELKTQIAKDIAIITNL